MDVSLQVVLVALIGIVPSVGMLVYNLRKARPDALQQYIAMTNEQAVRIDKLEKAQDVMRARFEKVVNWAQRLAKQVRELGGEPVPFDDPDEITLPWRKDATQDKDPAG